MSLLNSPELDDLVYVGDISFTKRQVAEGYDSKRDDPLMETSLSFGKECFRAQSCVADFIFGDTEMLGLEIAVIMYNHCLPEDHRLKKQHSSEDVRKYLAAARLWHQSRLA